MILSIHLGISFNQLMHNFHISHFSSNDKRGLTILLKKQLKFNSVAYVEKFLSGWYNFIYKLLLKYLCQSVT